MEKIKKVNLYVDGAFINDKIRFAYLLEENNNIISKKSGTLDKPEYKAHYQVAGELQAVLTGITECLSLDYKNINICYDYDGIKHWVTGDWKTKIPLTKDYKKIMKTFINDFALNIEYTKIKAHTGDKFNSIVDKMAKVDDVTIDI